MMKEVAVECNQTAATVSALIIKWIIKNIHLRMKTKSL